MHLVKSLLITGIAAVFCAIIACGGKSPRMSEAEDSSSISNPDGTGEIIPTAENNWNNGITDTDGFMRIAWRLQTQENVFGFNVYRADVSGDGEEEPEASAFEIINDDIIPGHGTTALPQEYEYIDSGLDIGRKYFYYVTEVTTTGNEADITPKVGAVAKPRRYYVERGQLPAE